MRRDEIGCAPALDMPESVYVRVGRHGLRLKWEENRTVVIDVYLDIYLSIV